MLIGTIDYRVVNRHLIERLPVLFDEAQTVKVARRKKPGHHAWMGLVDLPKIRIEPIRHEPKRGKWLGLGYFGDVPAELFLTFARGARGPLGFHDGNDIP